MGDRNWPRAPSQHLRIGEVPDSGLRASLPTAELRELCAPPGGTFFEYCPVE
jgi:hypothetical protein